MVKKKITKRIYNKRASFDYQLGDSLTVGIALDGPETKAARNGSVQLKGAYVNIINNELWLINATISGSASSPINDTDKVRNRKLLARRKEIDRLIREKNSGLTIIPIELLNKSRYIKLKIALGKGKKNYDKRDSIKKREQERKIQGYTHTK
ncbi:MAG TPA: SsrA-binding protein SmpB [Candidatus Saccharimonadia bacterium]|nr:SsrA-binding protein SmpB [Candidatus Saccharimonadia bacterium]